MGIAKWSAWVLLGLSSCSRERPPPAPMPTVPRPLETHQGSDGDLVVRDPTGQEIFLGNKLFSWTFHAREWDYANLTVESEKEVVLVADTSEGRNGIRPLLQPGYLLQGFGPVWVRIRGGYLLDGPLPTLIFRVYLGKTLVGRKAYDFRKAGRITGTSGMGMETTFWIEPIAYRKPGTSLRLRCHERGYAALGTADTSGLWNTAETETYSTLDGTGQLPIRITAQWSDHDGLAQAYVDGIDIFR